MDENTIREILRGVMDPELGMNVVDLNMIRKIQVEVDKVTIGLVLTTMACPLSRLIAGQIRDAVMSVPGVKEVKIELLDEPWEPAGDWKSWLNY
jgi:serine O-acetyltransferase